MRNSKHLHDRGDFIRHEQCPRCASMGRDNSGDNLAVYTHNVYCLACGYHAFTDSSFHVTNVLRKKDMKPIPDQLTLPMEGWQSKGIKKEITTAYGVEWLTKVSNTTGVPILAHDEDGVPYEQDNGKLRFPYYDSVTGKLVGYKYRAIRKEMKTGEKEIRTLNGQYFSVFGLNVQGTSKVLIITEGETDTMAWKQALPDATVWGVPGSQRTEKSLEQVIEKAITKYDKIYLAFDNDEAGREGLEVALSMLPPIKTYVVTYVHKDACETLLTDGAKGLKELIKNAQQVTPQDIISDEDLIERALEFSENTQALYGVTTGHAGIDSVMGGWTPGKVAMLAGDTGTGKTTYALDLTYKAICNGLKVFFIPLEMTPEQVILKLVEMHLQKAIISDPSAVQPSKEDKRKALEFITSNVKFLNRFGALSKEYLTQQIEVAVYAYKVNLVVLDHITAAATANGGGWAEIDQMIYALKASALQHRITVLVISHINKMGQAKRPTADMLRGSAALKQAVDILLLIHRNHKEEYTEVWTGKVDRFIGKMGHFRFEMEDHRFVELEDEYEDEEDDDEFDLEPKAPKVPKEKEEEAASYFKRNGSKVSKQVRERRARNEPKSGVRTRSPGVRSTSKAA